MIAQADIEGFAYSEYDVVFWATLANSCPGGCAVKDGNEIIIIK